MPAAKALVTLAIGAEYVQRWRQSAEQSWRRYAARHGYDLLCIEEPLDRSERARRRSPAWQKCLVASQDFARRYERLVWLDADIVINADRAPDVVAGVPAEKVGAVETWSSPSPEVFREVLGRLIGAWGEESGLTRDARDYYARWGLPAEHDAVVQTGVMVLTPARHRGLLESVYSKYEDKGDPRWHYEMRPLSYELLRAGVAHWIDPRFNLRWVHERVLHYPFLESPLSPEVAAPLRTACVTAALQNSYFLHFAGAGGEMVHADASVRSWRDVRVGA